MGDLTSRSQDSKHSVAVYCSPTAPWQPPASTEPGTKTLRSSRQASSPQIVRNPQTVEASSSPTTAEHAIIGRKQEAEASGSQSRCQSFCIVTFLCFSRRADLRFSLFREEGELILEDTKLEMMKEDRMRYKKTI